MDLFCALTDRELENGKQKADQAQSLNYPSVKAITTENMKFKKSGFTHIKLSLLYHTVA